MQKGKEREREREKNDMIEDCMISSVVNDLPKVTNDRSITRDGTPRDPPLLAVASLPFAIESTTPSFRTWLVVHPRCRQDGRTPNDETRRDPITKEPDAREETDDDTQARREPLEDVVRVFDDDGRDEATKDLDGDRHPSPKVEVVEG